MTTPAAPSPAPSNPTPPNPGAPTTTATASPAQATDGRFQPTEWRYPADYHVAELRGATADQAATYFKTFYTQALAGQPKPPVTTGQNAPAPQVPDDTAWLTAPADAFNRGIQNVVQNQFQPTISSLFQQNASTNRQLVAQRYPDVFEKWAPEVDALALQLDPQYRTYENLERIVKMVRSDHNDEIVAQKLDAAVNARLSAMGGQLRPDGSVAPGGPSPAAQNSVDLNSAELPEEYRQILAAVNMKPRDLPDFLRRYYGPNVDLDKAAKDWFEKAKTGKVITESRAGWRMERK